MNIVVMGAHPDDPESGCGGLTIKAVGQGHKVIWAYLSSGVPGAVVDGRPEDEVREEESCAACRVVGAEPYFFRYPMSDIPFDRLAYERVLGFLREVDADLVVTHWPVDTHPDHQAVGALGTQAVVGNPEVGLAYFEVATGIQTLSFEPNRYVDITNAADSKKASVFCHSSQNVDAWWYIHDDMERFRSGQANGYKINGRAEAYYLMVSTPSAEQLFESRNWLQPSGTRIVRPGKYRE